MTAANVHQNKKNEDQESRFLHEIEASYRELIFLDIGNHYLCFSEYKTNK